MKICYCGEPRPVSGNIGNTGNASGISAAADAGTDNGIKQGLPQTEGKKIKLAYSSKNEKIKLTDAWVNTIDENSVELVFSGESIYDRELDALLCNIKLLDAFGTVLSEKRNMNFSVAASSGNAYTTEPEIMELDRKLHSKSRKSDIEVLRTALV